MADDDNRSKGGGHFLTARRLARTFDRGSAVLASLVSVRHITREKLVDVIRERGAV